MDYFSKACCLSIAAYFTVHFKLLRYDEPLEPKHMIYPRLHCDEQTDCVKRPH